MRQHEMLNFQFSPEDARYTACLTRRGMVDKRDQIMPGFSTGFHNICARRDNTKARRHVRGSCRTPEAQRRGPQARVCRITDTKHIYTEAIVSRDQSTRALPTKVFGVGT